MTSYETQEYNFNTSLSNIFSPLQLLDLTIETIKSAPVPQSPRKSSQRLTCAVLNKSPVRRTRNDGSMFSMNLCGKDTSSTIRAVCFSEPMFSKFEPNKTYDINQFKVKKAYGKSTSNVELLIDNETRVSMSTSQFALEDQSFTISQILTNETKNVRFIKLKAKVMTIDDVHIVGTYPDNKSKRNINLADPTGHIQLVLWRDRAENIVFKVGDIVSIENAVISNYGNTLTVTTTLETTISVEEDDEMNVTALNQPVPNIMPLDSTILAIKEFSCAYACVDCRKDIPVDSTPKSRIVKCPRCSAVFLQQVAVQTNSCKVLLNNKQRFTAHSQASLLLVI